MLDEETDMTRRITLLQLTVPLLLAVVALSGCGGSQGDQPQVEKLTAAQAAAKQVLDDELRTRQQTTQIDR